MPTTADEMLRDFKRFTGDGLPDEPVGAPLPIGDPTSGAHTPTKAELRTALSGATDDIDNFTDNLVVTAVDGTVASASYDDVTNTMSFVLPVGPSGGSNGLPPLFGQAGNIIVVNAAEDDLDFDTIFELPAFAGNAGKAVVVNAAEDGVEYGVVDSEVTSGTWTPIINAGSTATSTGSDGLYSRVGDMVTVHFHIRGIAKGDIGSSTLTITGLPYAARNLTNSQLQFLGVFNQDGITGITDAQLRLDEGTSSLIFKKAATSDSVSLVTGSDMPTSGAVLNGTITYHTDDPV